MAVSAPWPATACQPFPHRQGFQPWSAAWNGRRDSNPHLQLGRLGPMPFRTRPRGPRRYRTFLLLVFSRALIRLS